MDLVQARAELEQMVREADASIAAFSKVEEDLEVEEGDTSEELAEAEREEALVDAAEVRRTEALEALARLDEGTYGKCVDCGQAIDKARLEFRPEAARCLADQQTHEDRGA